MTCMIDLSTRNFVNLEFRNSGNLRLAVRLFYSFATGVPNNQKSLSIPGTFVLIFQNIPQGKIRQNYNNTPECKKLLPLTLLFVPEGIRIPL